MAGVFQLTMYSNVIKERANFNYLETTSFTIIGPSSPSLSPLISNKHSISIIKVPKKKKKNKNKNKKIRKHRRRTEGRKTTSKKNENKTKKGQEQ